MRERLIFHHPCRHDAFVLLEASLLNAIFAWRQRNSAAPEAGGILLGLRRGEHVHVTGITQPGPDDRRARTAFHRARAFHQQQAWRQWRASGGVTDYLGEWHTHPEASPSPSARDIVEWRALQRRYSVPLLFLIVGTGDEMWFGLGFGTGLRRVSNIIGENIG